MPPCQASYSCRFVSYRQIDNDRVIKILKKSQAALNGTYFTPDEPVYFPSLANGRKGNGSGLARQASCLDSKKMHEIEVEMASLNQTFVDLNESLDNIVLVRKLSIAT